MARILIGTSGWHYDHWVGPFYPESTRPADRLAQYAGRFPAVEVNNTFYALPSPDTLASWRAQTPDGFVFACKASRYITHMKKLKDPADSLARFLDAARSLGDRLGPLLFQLPPNWRANPERLDALLAAVPDDLRCAVEARDESWFSDEIDAVLARHSAAFAVYDIDGRTSPVKTTADFAYVRLHGPGKAYEGSYDDEALGGWAAQARAWRDEGKDVYVFFDNDQDGHAPRNAARLMEMVGDVT
ncbi:DUF72 domain-containing protein [Roseospira navarrensis]|uniref:DUF72 domain-containing protein n=1 Tax=Roseospira navarrensis TaxID=140058 RepID=A0A7X1ZDZ5_9PROT|nr:DUF72 domain-containing protein [Roseospira navarrensis]MQX35821.1 DUF72 domain-containing protein [Roseospira navarrensis]